MSQPQGQPYPQGQANPQPGQGTSQPPSTFLWDNLRQGLFGPSQPQPQPYQGNPQGMNRGTPQSMTQRTAVMQRQADRGGMSGGNPQPTPQTQPQGGGWPFQDQIQGFVGSANRQNANPPLPQGQMHNQGPGNQGPSGQTWRTGAPPQQASANTSQRVPTRPSGGPDYRVGARTDATAPSNRGMVGPVTPPAETIEDQRVAPSIPAPSRRTDTSTRRARTEDRAITTDSGVTSSRRTTPQPREEEPPRPPARAATPPESAGNVGQQDTAGPASRRPSPASERPDPEATVARPTPAPPAALESPGPAPREVRPATAEPSIPRVTPAPGARPDPIPGNENVLFRRLGPALVVETLGPRRIVVGKEAAYRVVLRNMGDVAAGQAEITVQVPTWADVAGATPTRGKMTLPASSRSEVGLKWQVPGLRAGGSEELTLRLVPHESRAMELAVSLQTAAIDSQFSVEVREPKLQLAISGPKEVRYGEKAVYELTFSNPGSADAENVLVRLLPIDPGDEADTHEIGTIPAASKQSVEIELVARQTGTLSIRAEATAECGLKCDALREVTVLKPELKVEVSGPKFRYARTIATYQVRVTNPGNTIGRGVQVGAMLPAQANFVSASGGGQKEEGANNIRWKVPDLAAGGEQVFELKCELAAGGTNRIQVAALAETDLRDTAFIATEVEALADVDLDVHDPKGPLPVGEDVTYEVVIRNRGGKSADNVQVAAYFSDGIEPMQVLGQRHQIETGKVTLEPIVRLGPGEQIVARIVARASKPGNHVFRTEVQCTSLELKLSEQKTTRFYGEEPTAKPAAHPAGPSHSEDAGHDGSAIEPAAGEAAEKVTPSHPKPVDASQTPSFLVPQPGPGTPR